LVRPAQQLSTPNLCDAPKFVSRYALVLVLVRRLDFSLGYHHADLVHCQPQIVGHYRDGQFVILALVVQHQEFLFEPINQVGPPVVRLLESEVSLIVLARFGSLLLAQLGELLISARALSPRLVALSSSAHLLKIPGGFFSY
jgi:hypothetical protein